MVIDVGENAPVLQLSFFSELNTGEAVNYTRVSLLKHQSALVLLNQSAVLLNISSQSRVI